MSKLLVVCGSLLGVHLGSIMGLSVVAFGFPLGLHLGLCWCFELVGCIGGLCYWVASWVVFGIALLGPQTPNLGVGLSALMVVALFVVELVVVV